MKLGFELKLDKVVKYGIQNKKRLLLGVLLAGVPCLGATQFLFGFNHSHSRPVGMSDVTFDISPKGDKIVFSATGQGQRDIYLLDLKTSRVTQLTKTPAYEGAPTFSPDGKSILYTAGAPGERADHIFIRSLDGTIVRQLTAEDYNDTTPSFSHDASRIVFTRNRTYSWGGLGASWGEDSEVYVMKRNGTQLRRLTPPKLYAVSPKFLSDGKTVVFAGDGVQLVNSDKAHSPRQLTKAGFSDAIAVSPNGRQVVFIADPTGQNYAGLLRLFIINADGTGKRAIDANQVGLKPVFDPDGKHIYFLVETWPDGPSGTPKESLWQIATSGKHLRRIADTRLFDDPLRWRP